MPHWWANSCCTRANPRVFQQSTRIPPHDDSVPITMLRVLARLNELVQKHTPKTCPLEIPSNFLAGIRPTEVKRSAAHVHHSEIGRKIILTEHAGVRFRRGFREQNLAGDMRDDHLGVYEFKIANGDFLHAGAIYSFHEAASAACTVASERGHACSRFHRHLRVDERVC